MTLNQLYLENKLEVGQIFYYRSNFIDIFKISEVNQDSFCIIQVVNCLDYIEGYEYCPFNFAGWETYILTDEAGVNQLKAELL